MKGFLLLFFSLFLSLNLYAKAGSDSAIRGWNILSDLPDKIDRTLAAAADYQINHLQLSHNIIMSLNEVKNAAKCARVNDIIDKAHQAGIKEVTLWDHALYSLDYYPSRFKTGPGKTLDLDNPEFWKWFKNDYREMLNKVSGADGLILTFIETGARAEKQYSRAASTEAEKLAKVINNLADVVIGEFGKRLYIRTFSYNEEEYETISNAVGFLRYDEIILMMKETPHDFFLTHPNSMLPGRIARPTIVEFDEGNEYSGQGVIANTWVQSVLNRGKDLLYRDQVIGYVARTDRRGSTSIIDTPGEILLYALDEVSRDRDVHAESIYDKFITAKYGTKAVQYLKPAFQSAYDIITSSLYTLGTSTTCHSGLNYDPYESIYTRHVSGRWIDPPVVHVAHGVGKTFHYWKDIIEHLAPARFKTAGGLLEKEEPAFFQNGWISPQEMMTEEYLGYILTEKHYGVKKSEEALRQLQKAGPYLDERKLDDIYQQFYRTSLTARLHEAVCKAYFGYRLYARGEKYRTKTLHRIIEEGLADIGTVSALIESYERTYPKGEWDWKKDVVMAGKYCQMIKEGWSCYGNCRFE